MNDHRPIRAAAILAVLALAASGAPATAEEPSDEKSAEKARNILQWTTATEVDNFGYDVYRAESEDGPFERLNPDPIPGAGTSDEPTPYEYVDDTIDPYKTYWYYLESISMAGERERFTTTFRKKPKLERESDEADSDDEKDDPDLPLP